MKLPTTVMKEVSSLLNDWLFDFSLSHVGFYCDDVFRKQTNVFVSIGLTFRLGGTSLLGSSVVVFHWYLVLFCESKQSLTLELYRIIHETDLRCIQLNKKNKLNCLTGVTPSFRNTKLPERQPDEMVYLGSWSSFPLASRSYQRQKR